MSLDIEGTFDSAWWPILKCRLMELECPKNFRQIVDKYLEDRVIELKYAGASVTKKTNKGCLQGSIGGPLFWNVIIDPLLQALTEKGIYSKAFADDIVQVFSGHSTTQIQLEVNETLKFIL